LGFPAGQIFGQPGFRLRLATGGIVPHLVYLISNLIEELIMRSILLWLLGVPIPIIILIALFSH